MHATIKRKTKHARREIDTVRKCPSGQKGIVPCFRQVKKAAELQRHCGYMYI
jgi:hypothetical protein